MIEVARPAPTVEHLAPRRDRERIDRYLGAFLAEAQRRHVGNAHLVPLYEQVCQFVLRGGKRIRPRICLAAYRIVAGGDEEPPRPVWLAASSLEVFHAFMLVHDDLIDGSVLRRDHDSLHEALRRRHDRPDSSRARKLAGDLGIVGGDLLCALGMRMVGRAEIDPAVAPDVHRLLAEMLFETGLGEALDVLYDDCPLDRIGEEQILEAYLRKTARYSISGPLVLGAILAGASRAVRRALDRFGDLLGLGYQIRNDLEALAIDPEEGDHPDLDGGKRTLVLWTAHRLLPPPERRALERVLAESPGVARRRRLLELILESGAVEACEDRLQGLQEEALSTLAGSPLDADQRRSLTAFLDLLTGGACTGPTSAATNGHA